LKFCNYCLITESTQTEPKHT